MSLITEKVRYTWAERDDEESSFFSKDTNSRKLPDLPLKDSGLKTRLNMEITSGQKLYSSGFPF